MVQVTARGFVLPVLPERSRDQESSRDVLEILDHCVVISGAAATSNPRVVSVQAINSIILSRIWVTFATPGIL